MTRCLITGANGFLGCHLAEHLLEQGCSVYGTVHRETKNVDFLKGKIALLPCDIRDRKQVRTALTEVRPDVVFHLAAQSLPALSWKDPQKTFEINVFGTLNLLEEICKAGLSPTVVMAGSSAEYGFCTPDEVPIKEDKPLQPANPYGVSKVAAELLALLYVKTHGLKVLNVRLFFVIGPRKTRDVCSDFARQIVAVERGRQNTLKVGNLEPVRDFVAAGDAVVGLWLLARQGVPGEAYNLCSGTGRRIREVLDRLRALAKTDVPVEVDPLRLRPADELRVVGDNSKLQGLGWEPVMPLDRVLEDILAYWRRTHGPNP